MARPNTVIGLLLLLLTLASCSGGAPPEPGVPTPEPGPAMEATATLPGPTATVDLRAASTSPPATATPRAAETPTPAGLQMRRVTPAALGGDLRYEIIGYSTNGHAIESFQVGEGERELLFVGGIHGGYEWNTVLLAYQVVDYFAAYPDEIPDGVTLTVIPVANPDGLVAVTGRSGRFDPADVRGDTTAGRVNGNGVDLNRNWDCEWAPTSWWAGRSLSGGTAPFSEVETRVLRDFFWRGRRSWWSSGTAPCPAFFTACATANICLRPPPGARLTARRPDTRPATPSTPTPSPVTPPTTWPAWASPPSPSS